MFCNRSQVSPPPQFQEALLGYWTAQAEFEKALGEDK